jgi:hypothetical protein
MKQASKSSSGWNVGAGVELFCVGGGEWPAMVVCRSSRKDSDGNSPAVYRTQLLQEKTHCLPGKLLGFPTSPPDGDHASRRRRLWT